MKRILLTNIIVLLAVSLLDAATTSRSIGRWTISYDDQSHMVSFSKDGKAILSDVFVLFKNGNETIKSTSYTEVSFADSDVTEKTGDAHKFTITYKGAEGRPNVEQAFYLMEDKDYFLTDVTLVANGGTVASNYISPVYSEAKNFFLEKSYNNYFLTVPFDNDGFVTYGCYPLSKALGAENSATATGRAARDSISIETTSIFNYETKRGLVIGSVEHDTWKSAIRITGSPTTQGIVSKIEALSGYTSPTTRDHYQDTTTGYNHLQPHGTVKGNRVKSARFMVGIFDDWRTGMETYGEVNAQVAPKRPYNGPAVFGWNSWGGMEKHCNYEGAMSVIDFMKENLIDKGWGKDGVIYIGLDSWDNMNWEERKAFADKCHANGLKAGAYWTPWHDWNGSDSRTVEGDNGYTYAQTRVKVDGITKHDRYDPTSPAMKSLIDYQITKFKECGFDYLKFDFLCDGIKEADSFYDPNITTGVQAYNYGMKYLEEQCGDDIFIDLSIAPLFPSQYANARRISCDAWGEMWHISHMMNCLSFGWWLDRVYSFNDPDHLVMGDRSAGENISRMTTGAVTGYCILGDNLATVGPSVGTPESQEHCVKYNSNEKVNEVISLGRTFRPYFDNFLYGAHRDINLFYHETEDSYIIAHFNYGLKDAEVSLDLTNLDIDVSKVNVARSIECWTEEPVVIQGNNLIFTSKQDTACLFRLYKK